VKHFGRKLHGIEENVKVYTSMANGAKIYEFTVFIFIGFISAETVEYRPMCDKINYQLCDKKMVHID
jgi:hypothetical protein